MTSVSVTDVFSTLNTKLPVISPHNHTKVYKNSHKSEFYDKKATSGNPEDSFVGWGAETIEDYWGCRSNFNFFSGRHPFDSRL